MDNEFNNKDIRLDEGKLIKALESILGVSDINTSKHKKTSKKALKRHIKEV